MWELVYSHCSTTMCYNNCPAKSILGRTGLAYSDQIRQEHVDKAIALGWAYSSDMLGAFTAVDHEGF